ncbi:MAG TPA: protoporphyrinogen oxidase, partial [Desulfobacteraceae bacterium]|nr:protoporphyrinogen oxidase [Desulfobacteraceae bacterium]
HVLLEALVGGRRHPERLELDDDELVGRVCEDLRQLIDLPPDPCYARVMRPRAGIPQLEAGYPALLGWRAKVLAAHPCLHICGSGWHGIGINDMTKVARKVADDILAGTREETEETEVKGVYF